ncbi:MAG: hypothetical protein U9R50_09845 [Campylobacterota bacterium]|nr:hypothetical protein [Campylobacterota bacterium]
MKYLIALITLIFIGCSSGGSSSEAPNDAIDSKKIKEPSGLLVSKKYDNILWTHNDSGDDAYIYAIDARTLELVEKVEVKKADNVDWEDISYFGDLIAIGDFGNNESDRDDLTLYIIKEPNPDGDGDIKITQEVEFIFSDQKDYSKKHNNFDCEALFSYHESLFMLSKHQEDSETTLYKLSIDEGIADKVMDYNLGAQVTAADSDGEQIVILTKEALYLLVPTGVNDNIFDGTIYKKELNLGQIEGVAFDNKVIKIINEDSDVYEYSIQSIKDTPPIQI